MQIYKKVIAAVVWHEGKILLGQRPPEDTWGGYWEFPGGTLEVGESHEECLHRELHEELEMTVTILNSLGHVHFPTDKGFLEIHFYQCRALTLPQAQNAHSQILWHELTSVDTKTLVPADIPILKKLTVIK